MKVSLYKKGDWAKVKETVEPFMPLTDDGFFDDIALLGIAVTVTEDDKSICCGGVTFLSKDDGYVWIKINKNCITNIIATARVIRETFELMLDSMSGIKVSTYILDGFRKGERLARFVGMKKNCKSICFRNHKYNKFMVVI